MKKNATTATVKTPAVNSTGDVWMKPVFGGDGASMLVVGLVRFTPRGPHQLAPPCQRAAAGLHRRRRPGRHPRRAYRGSAGGRERTDPAGEEHFHGGTADNMMCHYAILDAAGATEATTWLEPVTDQQCSAAHTAALV